MYILMAWRSGDLHGILSGVWDLQLGRGIGMCFFRV